MVIVILLISAFCIVLGASRLSAPHSFESSNSSQLVWIDGVPNVSIGTANLDSRAKNSIKVPIFSFNASFTLDYQSNKFYWVDSLHGEFQTANLDGSGFKSFFLDKYNNSDLTIDVKNHKLYWVESISPDADPNHKGSRSIQSSNYDGSEKTTAISGSFDMASPQIDSDNGKIYWADNSGGAIRSANLDGSDMQVVISAVSDISGMKLDTKNAYIYWADAKTYKVTRSDMDGNNRVSILNDTITFAIDALHGKMYWVKDNSEIWQGNIDGSSQVLLTSLGISAIDRPREIKVNPNDGSLYWLLPTGIQTFDLTSRKVLNSVPGFAGPVSLAYQSQGDKFIVGDQINSIFTMDRDGTDIMRIGLLNDFAQGSAFNNATNTLYWTDGSDIKKLDLSNLEENSIISLSSYSIRPVDLALDTAGNVIYFSAQGIIARVNFDGSDLRILVKNLDEPGGIAFDASGHTLYWVDTKAGKIQAFDTGGSDVKTIVNDLKWPYDIVVDGRGQKLYWSDLREFMIHSANLDGTDIQDFETDVNALSLLLINK